MVTSLVAASVMNSVTGLIGTQGVFYALDRSTLYFPALICIDEWFGRRKGIAMGVMWARTGSAGVFVPSYFNGCCTIMDFGLYYECGQSSW